MDRGCCLIFDSSDPIVSFNDKLKPAAAAAAAAATSVSSFRDHIFHMGDTTRMFEFPGSLVSREEQPSSPSADNRRLVVGEVDFFSNDKNRVNDESDDDDDDDDDSQARNMIIKKENSLAQVSPGSSLNVNTGLHLLTANTASDRSTVDDGVSSHTDHQKRSKTELEQLQAELHRMNAENLNLKAQLSQVSNNYSALQMHLVALMQHQQQNTVTGSTQEQLEIIEAKSEEKKTDQAVTPRQFVHLRPSAETDELSHSLSDERTRSMSPPNNTEVASRRTSGKLEMGSPHDNENSGFRDGKRTGKEESSESESLGWNPNKVQKLNPGSKAAIDQTSEATMRKARVSVRARSEAPMITDGCQWRKYGQKMAKGNPCPRAYYRCTMAVGCPVRKQVQRCAEDKTILITTYEGNHNHPLPPAAMAMASTTTAAASMLLSGSMSSADGVMNPNLLARAILPCSSSMATISASAPFPTVTLDLTQNPSALQFQRAPAPFSFPFPGQPQNFASLPTPQSLQVSGQALSNQSQFSGLHLSQGISSSQLHHQGQPAGPLHPSQQSTLADTVSAATAAITADPNFTAALAAAISSIIGGANNNSKTNIANNRN